jgi:hypothetical protein
MLLIERIFQWPYEQVVTHRIFYPQQKMGFVVIANDVIDSFLPFFIVSRPLAGN